MARGFQQGHAGPVFKESWPAHDPELAREDDVEIPVQVNGKLRGRITVPHGTSKEGLEKAARRRYALFLVDVEMPGMDGFTFVATTQKDPTLRDIPAVLVTSRNATEDRARGTAVGAKAYIVKSEFDQNELLDRIGKLVA